MVLEFIRENGALKRTFMAHKLNVCMSKKNSDSALPDCTAACGMAGSRSVCSSLFFLSLFSFFGSWFQRNEHFMRIFLCSLMDFYGKNLNSSCKIFFFSWWWMLDTLHYSRYQFHSFFTRGVWALKLKWYDMDMGNEKFMTLV